MDELIYVKNSSYSEYESLLLRRDNLKKEAFKYDREYIRVFGDKILKVFKLKLSCISKKKEISFCQRILNHGGILDQEELQKFIEKEMEEYQKQLDQLVEDNANAKKRELVSEVDLLEIKKIYRKLTKQIHPDINPKTADTPELMDLWNRITIAYECNNLKDMKELEVLVAEAIESLGMGRIEIEIPDIYEKIAEVEAEIVRIRNTDPYMYKYILEDKSAIEEKNIELDEEYNTYIGFEEQLDELLNGIKGEIGGI